MVIPQQAYNGFYWYYRLLKIADNQHGLLSVSGNDGQCVFNTENAELKVVMLQGGLWFLQSEAGF